MIRILRWGVRGWGIWGLAIPVELLDEFTYLHSSPLGSQVGRRAWGRCVSGPKMPVYKHTGGIYIALTHMNGRALGEGLGEGLGEVQIQI